MSEPRNPIQPLVKDKNGTVRFKKNLIVEHLLYVASAHGCDLHDLAKMDFSADDRRQLAQLIGYSLSGFSDLSYADDETVETAQRMMDGESENDAKIDYQRGLLTSLRNQLAKPMAKLFGVHPDDLTHPGQF